jgi:tetratricopeptide (TPR) repeat protein
LYLQAADLSKGPPSKDAFERAFQLLDSAISIDLKYADAYALKSVFTTSFGNNYANGSEALAQNRAESLRLAQTALNLAPNLALAHRALFSFYSSNLQIAAADSEIKQSLQLASGDANILAIYANFAGTTLGDVDRGLRLSDQAIAMDPLNPRPYDLRLELLFTARRYRDAVDYGKKIGAKFPPQFGRALTIGDALLMLGQFQQAQNYYAQAPGDYWRRLFGETVLLIRSGNLADVAAKRQKFEAVAGDAGSYQYGVIDAQLGDKDRAFSSLDHAFAIKDGGMLSIRTDPWLDPIRSDPRFAALLQKMNFPA